MVFSRTLGCGRGVGSSADVANIFYVCGGAGYAGGASPPQPQTYRNIGGWITCAPVADMARYGSDPDRADLRPTRNDVVEVG